MAKNKEIFNTFDFIGTAMLPKKEDCILKTEEREGKFNRMRLSLGVRESESNGIFCDFAGNVPKSQSEMIKKSTNEVVDGKRQTIEFKFEDRNLDAIVAQIPDWAKLTVDLETDFEKKAAREKLRFQIMNLEQKANSDDGITDSEKEDLAKYKAEYAEKSDNVHLFVHEYDFLMFLHENLETIKANRIRVTGNFRKSVGKQYYTSYQPTKVELVSSEKVKDEAGNDTNEFKYPSKLEINSLSFYFDKDSVDNQLKKEKKVYVDGYVKSNVKKGDEYVEGYIPQQIVIDCTNIDLEDEPSKRMVDFVVSVFKCKKTLHNMGLKLNLKNGQEEVEFTEDMLTDFQKMQVAAGLHKVEDFKPRGNVYGASITEFRFSDFLSKLEQYAEGAIDTELKEDEYYIAPLVTQAENKSVEEVAKNANSAEESAISKLFK